MLNGFKNVQTEFWKIGTFSLRNKTLHFVFKTVGDLHTKRHDVRHCVDGELFTTPSKSEAAAVCKQLNTVGK